MFRKSMLFLFLLAVSTFLSLPALAARDIRVYITEESPRGQRFYTADPSRPVSVYLDGSEISYDLPALVFEDKYTRGRTMVPLRVTAEFMGADVEWHDESQTIFVKHDGDTAVLTVGNHRAEANGKEVMLDIAPVIIRGRTLVPLRFFSEALGCYVKWNEEKWSVFINTSGKDFPIGKNPGIYRHFNSLMRKEAVYFGKARRYKGLNSFYREWTSETLTTGKKKVYARIETPFLAIARAARIAAKSDRDLARQGVREILERYEEQLPFYVYVSGDEPDFAHRYRAYLEQGGKKTVSRERIVKDEVYQKEYLGGKDSYTAVIKFIFDPDEFATSEPVTLVVESGAREALRFHFDLPHIR